MRIARRHARHAMPEERLSDFIIDAKALQPGGKRVPQVMEVEVLDLRQRTHASPILLKRSDVNPPPKDSTVCDRGQRIVQG